MNFYIELASNCQTSCFLPILSRIGLFLNDKIRNESAGIGRSELRAKSRKSYGPLNEECNTVKAPNYYWFVVSFAVLVIAYRMVSISAMRDMLQI